MDYAEYERLEAVPKPVREDRRTCLSILFYGTAEEADYASQIVQENNDTYWGGVFHGMPCGRELERDTEVDGRKLYAVTLYSTPVRRG